MMTFLIVAIVWLYVWGFLAVFVAYTGIDGEVLGRQYDNYPDIKIKLRARAFLQALIWPIHFPYETITAHFVAGKDAPATKG